MTLVTGHLVRCLRRTSDIVHGVRTRCHQRRHASHLSGAADQPPSLTSSPPATPEHGSAAASHSVEAASAHPLSSSAPSATTTMSAVLPTMKAGNATRVLDVTDVTARVYFPNPLIGFGVRKFAAGRFVEHLGTNEYAVALENVHLSPTLEVNARVRVRVGYTAQHTGRVVAGVITAVNSNGTVAVFLDNNTFVAQLPPSHIYLAESRGRLLGYAGYHELMDWIADAGVRRRAHVEKIATVLFYRGWRADTMYRLTRADLALMGYIRQSDRRVVADKADWQRLHHVEMRGLLRERMKERDWRYFIQKYSGFVSANWAALGVLSVFMWQLTNYKRHQRSTQLKHAVHTLTRSHSRYVSVDQEAEGDAAEVHGGGAGQKEAHWRSSSSSASLQHNDGRRTRDDDEHALAGGSSGEAAARGWPNEWLPLFVQRTLSRLLFRTVESESETGTGRSRAPSPVSASASRAQPEHHAEAVGDDVVPYFFVERPREENWARQILREFDVTRPRIAVFTGMRGSGKSALLRRAIDKENKPALLVEVRGKEDALACIMRALRVPNPEACGNYLDFITDAFRKATLINGEPPVLVMTLRDGTGLSRLYNEVVTLACDRMLCQVLVEVSLESLSTSSAATTQTGASVKEWALPRLDFYTVPNFSTLEAHQYTQHAIDPIAIQHFLEVVGTNAADIDELFAAVRQREVDAVTYINYKLTWAMRQLRIALEHATPLPTASRASPRPATGTLSMTLKQNTEKDSHMARPAFIPNVNHHFSSSSNSNTHMYDSTTRPNSLQGSSSSASVSSLFLPLSPASMAGHHAWTRRQRVHTALKRLAAFEYTTGQHAAAQFEDLRDPVLEEIVLYDPIQDRWVFREKIFHTAARSCL